MIWKFFDPNILCQSVQVGRVLTDPYGSVEYRDLDMYQVDGMLSQNGEVLVSLPERHAYTCIAFIEMVRAVKSWSRDACPYSCVCGDCGKAF